MIHRLPANTSVFSFERDQLVVRCHYLFTLHYIYIYIHIYIYIVKSEQITTANY